MTYTITANPGYSISNVIVDGTAIGSASSYTFNNVIGDHIISAWFSEYQYTITASAGSGGSVSPSGSVSVNYGASRTFTITPNTGYHTSSVLVDGSSVGAMSSYTFSNVQADHTISASFSNQYTITASAGPGGTISPSGSTSVNAGDSQTFAITPNTGYQAASVLVDGVSVGAVTSYTFSNVQADHTITASFSVIQYVITASAGPGGSVSPSGSVSVNYGASQTFTITPNTGCQVADVLVDGVSVGVMSSYTFSNVQATHTISATFYLFGSLDHFIFASIISPQTSGTGFSITITAKDVNGNTVTSYSGTNTLTASTGTINPTSTTAFTSGVWTGSVTLTSAGTGISISTSGGGKSGTSNAIIVNSGTLSSFTIIGYPTSVSAGTNFGSSNVVVTAKDSYGNTVTSYTGSVYFTSTDSAAVLPYTSSSRYTFTSGDSGVHTFAGTGFMLMTAGSRTITVTTGTVFASSSAITVVNPFGLDGKISGSVGGTSLTLTLTTTYANDVLYVSVVTYGGYTTTVTSSGLTWTRRAYATYSSSSIRLETWYAVKTTSGSTTINIAVSGSAYTAAVAFGVSGANTASPFDVTPVTRTGSGTTASASITTTNANDFIIGAVGIDGTGTVNVGSGYTLILTQASSNRETSTEYKKVTSAGSNTVNFSLASDYWAIIADAIKKAP